MEDRTLLIAQFSAGMMDEGEFHYRNYAPGFAMSRHSGVHVVSLSPRDTVREGLLDAADIAVLHMVYDLDFVPWIEYRRRHGKATVYEISDDIDSVSGWPPLDESFASLRTVMKRLAKESDAVQFASETLSSRFSYLNACLDVFTNQMLVIPPMRRVQRGPEVVIGWGGSLTHLQDLAELAGPLIAWMAARDDVKLHLMAADPIWDLFAAIPSGRKKRFPTGSISDYYSFIDSLDVGIGPLRDTRFNRARTDVKYLEYAARGVVAIMQATGPYCSSVIPGVTGFLYEDAVQLVELLDQVTRDLRLRVRIVTAARDYVERERHQFHHSARRLEFYKSLLHNPGAGPGRGLFETLAQTEGALAQGRYLLLPPRL